VRSYRIVRLGTTKGERRALRAYRRTGEADPDTLARLSGLSRESIDRLMPILVARDSSIDQPNPAGLAMVDRLASSAPSPEEHAITDERRRLTAAELEDFLREIPSRERTIIRSRLLRDVPVTLEALGRRFGISKERVRQLEERALAQLKDRLLACGGLAEAC
jgi:RNA polymerase sigma-32 factor